MGGGIELFRSSVTFDIKKIKVFVLDEADVMIDSQGHQSHSVRIQRSDKFYATYILLHQFSLWSRAHDENVHFPYNKKFYLNYLFAFQRFIQKLSVASIFCHLRRKCDEICTGCCS